MNRFNVVFFQDITTCKWECDEEAILFWDKQLSLPSEDFIGQLLAQPADVWHAGLSLGTKGLPTAINYVQPLWMLNRDADSDIESTSWRITPRACLVRTEVIRRAGGMASGFKTPNMAFLEMGHRWITNGVLIRHVPGLVSTASSPKGDTADFQCSEDGGQGPHFEDELRFVYYRFGKKWAKWMLGRIILKGHVTFVDGLKAWNKIKKDSYPYNHLEAFHPNFDFETATAALSADTKVTVLIPTLHRYSHLKVLLDQLRRQTVKPFEIIIVDQSDIKLRDKGIAEVFKDLPLKIIYLDEPGQCTSRNLGIQLSTGEQILLSEDDVEIEPDYIEKHLRCLSCFDVSSGIINEMDAPLAQKGFDRLRYSDVFPGGNTMVRKSVFVRSGLFDIAYNRKPRADGDLGMRVYLSGAQMILNPIISVLHHRAPEGGLRQHKARKITYAASRKSLWVRHLPSDSEIYLGLRYFSEWQVREFLWHKIFGTFSVSGNFLKKTAKVFIGILCLPHSLIEIQNRYKTAVAMFKEFPQIDLIQKSQA